MVWRHMVRDHWQDRAKMSGQAGLGISGKLSEAYRQTYVRAYIHTSALVHSRNVDPNGLVAYKLGRPARLLESSLPDKAAPYNMGVLR